MLKPLTIIYQDREITLECTHKKVFPPPQMYGSTPDDIDNLWKQGAIDQNQHQHLKVWQEKCGLMVMGPRCLDCPLALKQNPRPGRPHVIETEPWLPAKRKMHWDDMKAGKLEQSSDDSTGSFEEEFVEVSTPPSQNSSVKELKETLAEDSQEAMRAEEVTFDDLPKTVLEDEVEDDPKRAPGLADDLLDALAED